MTGRFQKAKFHWPLSGNESWKATVASVPRRVRQVANVIRQQDGKLTDRYFGHGRQVIRPRFGGLSVKLPKSVSAEPEADDTCLISTPSFPEGRFAW
jgi:hypothetical protein